jgi:hypothetical protein
MNVPGVSDEYLNSILSDVVIMSDALRMKLDYLSLAAIEDIEDIRVALAHIVQDIVVKEEVEVLEHLFDNS